MHSHSSQWIKQKTKHKFQTNKMAAALVCKYINAVAPPSTFCLHKTKIAWSDLELKCPH